MLFTRRTFLKAVVVNAAVINSISGCGSSGTSNAEEPILIEPAFFPQGIASGDPKPDGVVLWARLFDPELQGNNLPARVQMATNMLFKQPVVDLPLMAQLDFDNCIKVKVVGLVPQTVYYYRFIYLKGSNRFSSRPGRAKTAPLPEANVPIKFGIVNCQDYLGRYYNTFFKLLEEELDFVVHLGDYIYETVGDPTFQITQNPKRTIIFNDEAGALRLDKEGKTFYAAASLDNYRQLYRTYRSDPLLQQIHEQFPMIAIWDDHEFSEDCWGATATYTDGRQPEYSEERRRNAEQAWSEYMPADLGEVGRGVIELNPATLYPHNRIYRDLRFGQHLHLVMTDYRSYRSDHLIPEDAFPGAIAVTEAALAEWLDVQPVRSWLVPYLNIDNSEYALYKPILIGTVTEAYRQAGASTVEATQKALTIVQGLLDAQVVNQLLQSYNSTLAPSQRLPLLSSQQMDSLARGLSWALLGKQKLLSSLGSRYMVVKPSYDLYATYKFLSTSGEFNAWGQDQAAWFKTTLTNSTATWKIVGSSVPFTSLQLELNATSGLLPTEVRALMATLPPSLRQHFYLNVDQWDGFKEQRAELLKFMESVPNTLIISGDAHAAWVSQHSQRTFEFTIPPVTSDSFRNGILRQIQEIGLPNSEQWITYLDTLLKVANPAMNYANSYVNGVGIMQVDGQNVQVTYHLLPPEDNLFSYYEQRNALDGRFERISFNVSR